MLKNKDFKTIYYSARNQCYQRKVVPQVNLVIPPVVNRLISVQELRAKKKKKSNKFLLPLRDHYARQNMNKKKTPM